MKAFVKDNLPIIKALLIIGPGMKKEQIVEYINIPVVTLVKSADINTPIMPFLLELISVSSSSTASQQLKEIDSILAKNPDLLAFGDDLKSDNIKVVYDNQLVVQKYGGPVGIRYYADLYMGLDDSSNLNNDNDAYPLGENTDDTTDTTNENDYPYTNRNNIIQNNTNRNNTEESKTNEHDDLSDDLFM